MSETYTLTPTAAALRLGCSAARVRQLCDEGKLDAIKTPLGRLISADSLDSLIARGAVRGKASLGSHVSSPSTSE